ncbi:hypothetical protein BDF22DRAFT_745388 [Syncephalis plumigaleata]|nr:hypothetical protein BDF22DRAFT_745388 [Syncephalis plumigaleata]
MDAEWQKNATTWASVPSHPLGEVSIFRYISGELETEGISRGRAQGRLHGFHIILASDTITSLIFAHNLYLILKILVKQPRNFIAWCCLGTALLGVIPGIMIWLAAIADLFNCSQIGFYYIQLTQLLTPLSP